MTSHRTWRRTLACLFLMATASTASAQFPSVPGVPATPGVPAAPSAATPAAASPATSAFQGGGGNIWSKICLTPEQKAACKKHWCESGIGQMFGMMMKPMTFATGGMIKGCCPGPNDAKPEDLAKPSDSADGAAARVKEDEAQAKERRANVRYLSTVDCSRYPEVEKALINALRTDRNECVRLEAAIGLGGGCCCTKKTIEALRLTVLASDKDGNPKEISHRVRAAAEASLYACESTADLTPEPPEPVPSIEKKDEPAQEQARIRPRLRPIPVASPVASTTALPATLPAALPDIQPAQMVAQRPAQPVPTAAAVPMRVPTGQRGLVDLFRRSFNGAEPPR